MTTLYDTALLNFRAAADMLMTLDAARIDLVGEARSGLVGRQRIGLVEGYNDVTAVFGTCLPRNGRAEVQLNDTGRSIDLRCGSADWMTLEGKISLNHPGRECYLELQLSTDHGIFADLFIREFLTDGTARDSGHRECHIMGDEVCVCKLPLPDITAEDVVGQRIIIHLRQPAQRMLIDRLAITLI